MHPAINPIMFKGFMLGYLHKTAAGDASDYDKDIVTKSIKRMTPESGADSPTPGADPSLENRRSQGGGEGIPIDYYGDLGSQLKKLWPGATAGAIGTGAASIGVDSLRGQPPNIKRAIILSLVLGIPLGAAAQMGVMGGADAYKQFGRNVAGSSKKALADLLRKGGEGKQWAQNKYQEGKDLANRGLDAGKAALDKGGPAGVQRFKANAPTTPKTPNK